MKTNLLTNLNRTLSRTKFLLKKHSPEIMVVAGCVGAVTATVMACKETLKLEETLDECKERIDNIEELNKINEYSEAEYRKEIITQTAKNALAVAKLYAPAAILEITSIGLIFKSNNIMRQRNASLAAAYATLDSMYKKYRKNVVETFGADIDRDMRYGIKHEKVEEVVVDENGKEHKVKTKVDVINGDFTGYSDYARFFDQSNPNWSKNPEYNLMFLKAVESYCNNLLIAEGYLFLNDVYKQLGIEPTKAGQSAGWIYDKENAVGDNYVDFGIYNGKVKANRDFVNGIEPVILLDFNIDGDILNDPRLSIWSK